MDKGLMVLSLFDGCSGGQIALNRLGIKIKQYYASEIDKNPIKLTQHHYPNTIQIGDIKSVSYKDDILYCENGNYNIGEVDLMFGGFPCQSFSSSGKELNFNDPRGLLFFDLVRIFNEVKPKHFLFENVKMRFEFEDVINNHIGVKPILINSRLVSGQDRKRNYWTNINNGIIPPPEDKNISWSDISDDGWFAGAMRGRRIDPNTGSRGDYNKNIPIKQYIESRKDNKTNCLTTVSKDNIVSKYKVGRTELKDVERRYLSRLEMEKLQTLPIGYTDLVSLNQARKIIGNGWNIDTITHILSFLK